MKKIDRVIALVRANFLLINKKKIKKITKRMFIDKGMKLEIENRAFLYLLGEINIRRNCSICIREGAIVELGKGVFANEGCKIIARKNIKIGNNVQLGQNVMIFDHDHDFQTEGGIKSGKFRCSDVVIGDNVWIGANTIILRGTQIGNNCVIGAGSVIKGKYPNNMLIIQSRKENIKSMN